MLPTPKFSPVPLPSAAHLDCRSISFGANACAASTPRGNPVRTAPERAQAAGVGGWAARGSRGRQVADHAGWSAGRCHGTT